MKKILAAALCVSMLLCLISCGGSGNGGDTSEKADNTSDITEEGTEKAAEAATTAEETTAKPVTTPATEPPPTVRYLADIYFEYHEDIDKYILFFGLWNEKDEYIAYSGTAGIVIKDNADKQLYQGDIKFSSRDFSSWSRTDWDTHKYLCALKIDPSEIEKGTSPSGTLYLNIKLDNDTYFNEQKLTITDLPTVDVKINFSNTFPAKFTDTRYYSNTNKIEVQSVDNKTYIKNDGTASIEFTAMMKLISRTNEDNKGDYISVAYKLYDSSGVIVSSGFIAELNVSVGETVKTTFYVNDLDPRGEYTLKLEDAK